MTTVAERVADYRAQLEVDYAKGLASAREHSTTAPERAAPYFALYEKVSADMLELLVTVFEARLTNEVVDTDRAIIVGSSIASALATVLTSANNVEGLGLFSTFNRSLATLLTGDVIDDVTIVQNGEVSHV